MPPTGRFAVVSVLPANPAISIEGRQSGGERVKRWVEGGRSQGLEFGATASVLFHQGGYPGDPWQQTKTAANEQQGPAHFDRSVYIWTLSQKHKCCLLLLRCFMRKHQNSQRKSHSARNDFSCQPYWTEGVSSASCRPLKTPFLDPMKQPSVT